MRFFHLSDLHIGLKLMNRDLREDQEHVFRQIVDYAGKEQPEAVVIAGDIYDKAVPSAEAVELFDRFISGLAGAIPRGRIMMISGNHDSASRVNVFRSVLKKQGIHMIGMPPQRKGEHVEKVTLEDAHGKVNFYLLPFVKPSMVREIVGGEEPLSYDESLRRLLAREKIDPRERNVLVSHQFYLPPGKGADEVERMESEIRTVGNIDEVKADVLAPFDYAALGHVHKPMKVGGEVYRYPGTSLACSVSEAGQSKGIILVELGEKGTVGTRVLPLSPLREIRVIRGTLEEVLARGCNDYATVLLTDPADLDVIDMQDRLRRAFPYLLEIRRETLRGTDYDRRGKALEKLEPFDLICSFLKDMDEEEKALVRDVLQRVQEVS